MASCAMALLRFDGGLPPAMALDPARAFTQYRHSQWRAEDGLPREPILSIVQTQDGYLWVGTGSGLARFDGQQFTVFSSADSPALIDDEIDVLEASSDGSLWCGTRGGGLIRYQHGRFTSLSTKDGLPSNRITSLSATGGGRMWVGTDHGVCELDNGRVATRRPCSELAGDTVLAICPSRDGSCWVATAGGRLGRLREDRFTPMPVGGFAPQQEITAISEDGEGALWVGTTSGLRRLKDGRVATYTSADGLPHDVIGAIRIDRQGSVWVGTHRGLSRFYRNRFARWNTAEGTSNDMVMTLYEDVDGSLWTGTLGGELSRLSDGFVTVYGESEGLSHDVVMPVCGDSEGAVWIGTYGGLNRVQDGAVESFTVRSGLPSDSILSLCPAAGGGIWVGTRGRGLCLFKDGHAVRSFTTRDGLTSDLVLSMCEGPGGELWVGTGDGVCRSTGRRFVRCGPETSAAVPALHYQSSTRSVWAGTRSAGLLRYTDRGQIVYTTADGLADDAVFCFYEDGEGTLWIGTESGLSRWRDGTLTSVSKENGLPSDEIFGIIEDDGGHLWLSSLHGLVRVSKRDLERVARGEAGSVSCTEFGRGDGMRTAECTGGFQPPAWRDARGLLWFPTRRGVARVDPAGVWGNTAVLSPQIVALIAAGRAVDLRQEIVLSPHMRNVELRYTAPTLLAPDKVRFQYRLAGVDGGWIDAGARRAAFYANIPSGRHTFSVRASLGETREPVEVSIKFAVRPYFYQTAWFYLLSGTALLATMAWLHRLRTRQLRARTVVLEERMRIARDLHDTLAQDLAGIRLHFDSIGDHAASDPAIVKAVIDRARTSIQQSLDEVRQVIWDLRRSDGAEGDLPEMLSEAENRAHNGAGDVAIRMLVLGSVRAVPFALAHQLARIAQEALHNAVHHAGARCVVVELAFAEGGVRLAVRDDGTGFDPESDGMAGSARFGLRGMRERARLVGGRLEITSSPDGGTQVAVEAPFRTGRRGGGSKEA